MSTVLEPLPTQLHEWIPEPTRPFPSTHVTDDDDQFFLDQSPDRAGMYQLVDDEDRSEALIILCLSRPSSGLRLELIKCLSNKDLTLKFLSTEKQLWRWLEQNASQRVASVVLEAETDAERIVSRSHSYYHVRSILVRCRTSELGAIERQCRSLIKVDGIFDDDTRLLIKLVVDLTLYSEEMGDDMKEDQNNILAAERHYDRAMKLCNLVESL